ARPARVVPPVLGGVEDAAGAVHTRRLPGAARVGPGLAAGDREGVVGAVAGVVDVRVPGAVLRPGQRQAAPGEDAVDGAGAGRPDGEPVHPSTLSIRAGDASGAGRVARCRPRWHDPPMGSAKKAKKAKKAA